MESNLIYDAIISKVAGPTKTTPGGWRTFNCPACIHNGQPRPDTKKRGGLRLTSEGVTVFNCFNCTYATSWQPGRSLNKKMESLLTWLGMPPDELKRLNFKVWQIKERALVNTPIKEWFKFEFPETKLPDGCKPILEWANQESHDPNFLTVLEYLSSRGEHLFEIGDYYWTPNTEHDLNRRLLIPFKWQGKIVGWTGRAVFDSNRKYFSVLPQHYIFNTDVIKPNHEFIIVCEGPFDALAVGGVATLGNHISEDQCKWLNIQNKKIVVVPDREKSGDALVNIAKKQGWYVSFPKWDRSIKDAAEANKYYGRLFTLWSIISEKTSNPLSIQVRRELDLKHST